MTFDFDKAKAALASNPVAAAFLDNNKAYLVNLGQQAITQIVTAYLAGNDQAVVTTFWTLDQQAAAMVTGSADVAQRQKLQRVKKETLGRARQVIDKQMRVAQEIAGLLGRLI